MMSRINQHEQTSTVSWKPFVKITLESLISFYIATFCVAMFYIHRGENWLLAGIILALLYLFVIVVCAKRVFEKTADGSYFSFNTHCAPDRTYSCCVAYSASPIFTLEQTAYVIIFCQGSVLDPKKHKAAQA